MCERRKGVEQGLTSLIIYMNCVGGGGVCKLSSGGGRGGNSQKVFLHKYFSQQNPGTVATGVRFMNGWACRTEIS